MNFIVKELFLEPIHTCFNLWKKLKSLYKDEITFYLKVLSIQMMETTLI